MNEVNPEYDLSIVIVSFNTREMTRECIESVYSNPGGLNLQVVVVDNNSADDSIEVIENAFPHIELIKNTENLGFAAANNQGFDIATGKYVLLLNSDTVILGDVLKNSVDFMNSHKNVGGLGCRILNTDMTMQSSCSGYPTLVRLLFMTLGLNRILAALNADNYMLRHWKRDTEREVEVISGCYLLTRRTVLDEVGGLDEDFFFFGEETDWCLKVRKAGWRLMFSPVGEIIHHGGGSVKKLNYKRDVMLTDATIRLHRKNNGLLSAYSAFVILMLFNFSRAVMWTVVTLFRPAKSAKADHFRKVFSESLSSWPGKK